jgi:hypothetical protein
MSKVPVQKGKIVSNPPTMKQMTYVEKVKEAKSENTQRRSGQTLDMKSPRKKK